MGAAQAGRAARGRRRRDHPAGPRRPLDPHQGRRRWGSPVSESRRGPAAPRASWQTIDSGQLLLIAFAGLFVIVAITQVAAVRLEQPNVAIIFGVLIALGELFRMVMPGNREVAPIASAGAIGYALLVGVGPAPHPVNSSLKVVPAGHSPLQVVAV